MAVWCPMVLMLCATHCACTVATGQCVCSYLAGTGWAGSRCWAVTLGGVFYLSGGFCRDTGTGDTAMLDTTGLVRMRAYITGTRNNHPTITLTHNKRFVSLGQKTE